tara:strand:- start:3372 stop:3845 length:474 start_codon:yes stop_codon:yes gene_type:complete
MATNKNIDDETRKRAKAFVEKNNKGMDSEGYDSREYRSDPYSAMTQKERDSRVGLKDERSPAVVDDATKRLPAKKARVVSKKELEDSGLNLRDFLNKERGLTRRKEPMSKEEAKKQLKLGEKPSAKEVDDAKKQLGFAKGGYVNCGASVPPAQKGKK